MTVQPDNRRCILQLKVVIIIIIITAVPGKGVIFRESISDVYKTYKLAYSHIFMKNVLQFSLK